MEERRRRSEERRRLMYFTQHYLTQHPRLANIRHVDEDIVSRMTVQRCPQPLLVEVVSNESDAPAEDEQAVEGTDPDVLVGLFGCEGAGVTEEVDEADSNASIDVEDERVLLRRRDLLDRERVVEQAVAGEVLAHVLLHELDTEIGVVHTLDLVADTADCSDTVSRCLLQRKSTERTY